MFRKWLRPCHAILFQPISNTGCIPANHWTQGWSRGVMRCHCLDFGGGASEGALIWSLIFLQNLRLHLWMFKGSLHGVVLLLLKIWALGFLHSKTDHFHAIANRFKLPAWPFRCQNRKSHILQMRKSWAVLLPTFVPSARFSVSAFCTDLLGWTANQRASANNVRLTMWTTRAGPIARGRTARKSASFPPETNEVEFCSK